MGNLFCSVLTQGQRRRHVSAGGPALPSSFQSTRSPQWDIRQRLTTPLGAGVELVCGLLLLQRLLGEGLCTSLCHLPLQSTFLYNNFTFIFKIHPQTYPSHQGDPPGQTPLDRGGHGGPAGISQLLRLLHLLSLLEANGGLRTRGIDPTSQYFISFL